MEKKVLIFIKLLIIVSTLISLNLVNANVINIASDNISENNFLYLVAEDYSFVEGFFNNNLHSYIRIEFIPNFSESSSENLTLVFEPFNQDKHLNSSDIKLINVSLCLGSIEGLANKTPKCNKIIKDLTNQMEIENLLRMGITKNYYVGLYSYSFSPKDFKNNERYSFFIEYKIKGFVVKQGNDFTIYDIDEMPKGSSREFFLPKGASPKNIPETAFPYIIDDKRWEIAMQTNPSGWYFITYEIIPWYEGLWAYIISFLAGGILVSLIFFFLNDRSLKKHKVDIITKIRRTLYQKRRK